jgi:hypothetical protein
MNRLSAFRDFVSYRGVSLELLGLSERALSREDAMRAVELVRNAGVPILGGDVYVDQNGEVASAYANWYVERGERESEKAFAARSYSESRAYISGYPDPPDGMPMFVLVTGDENGS